MAKQLLIETRMNSLSLLEGVQSKNPNCLGTLYGPCADYKNATRNDNFYSRKLWENVFKDPLVKESLEDRVLIGELDHPGDRLETKATNACIVMTDYDFDDDNGVVNGKFDILNTPNGKILRSLLDYGCKIGVSSRGEGDVTDNAEGKHVVAEDGSYYFVAFDAVVLPAVKKAKPSLRESVQKRQTLKESLVEQINTASTNAELELIKKVIEATELPDVDSLYESINNKSKELEGTNSSSNLLEDLEKATKQVSELTEENRKLKGEVTGSKSRLSEVFKSRRKLQDELKSRQSATNELQESYNDLAFSSAASSNRVKSLEEELRVAESKSKRLQERLNSVLSSKTDNENLISSLEESLADAQSDIRKKSDIIKDLKEQISQLEKEKSQIIEESSQKSLKSRREVSLLKKSLKESEDQNSKFLSQYAETQSRLAGVNPQRILESIGSVSSPSEIDKLIDEELDRTDRYRKLPTRDDKLITALSESKIRFSGKSVPIDEESSATKLFMEQVVNLKK